MTVQHTVMTSSPSNAFGMDSNNICEPYQKTQCLPSLMLLWVNGSESLEQRGPKSEMF